MHTIAVDSAPLPTRSPGGWQRIAVPAYFDPGPGWDDLLRAVPAVALAILNLESGPGGSLDAATRDQVGAARAAGVTVLGYVDTANSGRDPTAVHADTCRYFEWYGVDGIFFDQTHVPATKLKAYYRPLYQSVKRQWPHSTVVLNPGAEVAECVLSAADIVVDFEGFYRDYLPWRPPPWARHHPPTRFWHIIHDVASAQQLQRAQALSQQRRAGYLYVTDQTHIPQPPDIHLYDRLPRPRHWSALQSGLAHSSATDRTAS